MYDGSGVAAVIGEHVVVDHRVRLESVSSGCVSA